MSDYDFVSDNVYRLRERVALAAKRAGRDPEGIRIMAVTKFHPIEATEAAWAAGLRLFGENRVQEAEGKYPGFLAEKPAAGLEMIGTLQTNKARKAIALFSRIQSVDSLKLLRELDKCARAADRNVEILFELHTGEESKAGFPGIDALLEACELAASLSGSEGRASDGNLAEDKASPGLLLRGLMTMAPYTKEEAPIRASFRALCRARDEVLRRFAFPAFDELSMGMTNDYEIAIEEGSTLVRVGTALFGSRAP